MSRRAHYSDNELAAFTITDKLADGIDVPQDEVCRLLNTLAAECEETRERLNRAVNMLYVVECRSIYPFFEAIAAFNAESVALRYGRDCADANPQWEYRVRFPGKIYLPLLGSLKCDQDGNSQTW